MAEDKKLTIQEKLMHMRVDFIEKKIKRTGKNKYSDYDYYTLDDILPTCTKIAANYNVLFKYEIGKRATLELVNLEDLNDTIIFSMPVADAVVKGANGIQNLGATMTYSKRYLYMNAFEVAEPDSLDEQLGSDMSNKQLEKMAQEESERIKNEPVSPAKLSVIRKLCQECSISEETVCHTYNVEKLEDITESLFAKVMSSFEKAKKAKQSL